MPVRNLAATKPLPASKFRDDITVIGERTASEMAGSFASTGDGVLARWAAIGNIFMLLRNRLRELGLHCFLSAHPMTAWADKQGVRHKGGPAFPGKVAPVRFPPVCDGVFRAVLDPAWPDPLWKAYYEVDPHHPDWFTKDRHDQIRGKAPMNTAEILRLAGYDIARCPGLEWQEAIVEACAIAVTKGASWDVVRPEIMAWARKDFLQGWDREAAACALRWTERDAWARSYLYLQREAKYQHYGV